MPLFIQRISWLTFGFLSVFLGCCIRSATQCPRLGFGVSMVLEPTFVATISSNVQMVTWCPVSRLGNFFTPANLVTELWNATHYLYPRRSFTAIGRATPTKSSSNISRKTAEKKPARPWPQKRSTMQRSLAQQTI